MAIDRLGGKQVTRTERRASIVVVEKTTAPTTAATPVVATPVVVDDKHAPALGLVVDKRPTRAATDGKSTPLGVRLAGVEARAPLTGDQKKLLKEAAKLMASGKASLDDVIAMSQLCAEAGVAGGFAHVAASQGAPFRAQLLDRAVQLDRPAAELRQLRDVAAALGEGAAVDERMVAAFARRVRDGAGDGVDWRARAAKVGLAAALDAATATSTRAADERVIVGSVIHPPSSFPAFPDLVRMRPKTPVQGGGGLRRRWADEKGALYEWDSQHGKLEKYTSKGKHVGELDPNTGERTKPADPTRSIEP